MKNNRLKPVTAENAQGEVKEFYQQIQKKMNILPNIFKNMGNSAAVIKGYFFLSEAASNTSISPQLREQIALAVGQANNCEYCLSAHTLISQSTGLDSKSILEARKGSASNPKDTAVLQFVKKMVEKKGHVSDEDVSVLKGAGVSDKELAEIILIVTLNMFTNYFNLVTGTEVDFPPAPKLA